MAQDTALSRRQSRVRFPVGTPINEDIMELVLWVTLIIVLVVVGPFLTLWALNTLFPVLAIPYALNTWAAAFVLNSVLYARVGK